jgi:hypothetical protein
MGVKKLKKGENSENPKSTKILKLPGISHAETLHMKG